MKHLLNKHRLPTKTSRGLNSKPSSFFQQCPHNSFKNPELQNVSHTETEALLWAKICHNARLLLDFPVDFGFHSSF